MNKTETKKLILSYVNITELELCRELNKQMEFLNKDEKDIVAKKECIKFLKSIKKNILILCALKRKKFNNEPK
jgi:hypothetical protein